MAAADATTKTCRECARPVFCKGLCTLHDARMRRHGSVSIVLKHGPPVGPVEPRFWSKVDRSAGPDACWLWTAGLGHRFGYGSFWANGKGIHSHRFSWELHHGPIPSGLCVLHNCPTGDNPRCVNPAHLFLGTKADNSADRDAKGRTATGDRSGARLHPEIVRRGERHHGAKLTEADVREIRTRPDLTGAHFARHYGVTPGLIAAIRTRRIWRHVT